MKKAILVLISLVLFSSVLGCFDKEENEPTAVVVLGGNIANSEKVNVESNFIREPVAEAVRSYGYLAIIVPDGNPNIVVSGSCDIKEYYKHADSRKLEEEAEARTKIILNSLNDAYADSPELDTLAGLRLAVQCLNEAPSNSKKTIVVSSTGVDTSGSCDFRNNIINAEPEAVANALAELEAIPDLTGITVTWVNMGAVAEPQKPLSPKQKNKLVNIWKAIILKGGGIPDIKDVPSGGVNLMTNLPTVSTIDFGSEMPISFDTSCLNQESNRFSEPSILSEEQVRFVADSDVLVNPDEANEVLNPIVEYMLNKTDFNLLLIGTTAGDGLSDYSISLSNKRAERIKKILVENGVSEDRIITIGMGGADPWHIYNVGTSGELAAQNRKVILIDADSPIAKELIK